MLTLLKTVRHGQTLEDSGLQHRSDGKQDTAVTCDITPQVCHKIFKFKHKPFVPAPVPHTELVLSN